VRLRLRMRAKNLDPTVRQEILNLVLMSSVMVPFRERHNEAT